MEMYHQAMVKMSVLTDLTCGVKVIIIIVLLCCIVYMNCDMLILKSIWKGSKPIITTVRLMEKNYAGVRHTKCQHLL